MHDSERSRSLIRKDSWKKSVVPAQHSSYRSAMPEVPKSGHMLEPPIER